MNFEFKNKKIIIFAVIIVLILIIGGVFYWWENREIKGSPEDYVIKETEQGKIVENKKASLTIKVPEGWEVKKIDLLEGSLAFYTQDVEGGLKNGMVNPPFKKGCAIGGGIIYKKMSFNEIKAEIKEIHVGLGITSEEFETITIKNYQALKNIFNSEVLGPSISVYIPNRNKIYNFGVYWAPEEKERCVQEFDKFLEAVEIK